MASDAVCLCVCRLLYHIRNPHHVASDAEIHVTSEMHVDWLLIVSPVKCMLIGRCDWPAVIGQHQPHTHTHTTDAQ